MAKQTINLGSGELAGDGESLRSAFSKTNDNFDEVYALSEANNLSNVSQNIIPSANEVYDLGSPTRRFKDLHLSGDTIFLGEGQISITEDGTIEFSGDARQVELVQKDIVGDVYSEDSTLIIDGGTGFVLNLGGQQPSYYLDYNNFINAPVFSFNTITDKPGIDDILGISNTSSRSLTVGSIETGQIIGNGADGITNIVNVTSLSGDLNNFLNIAGAGGGNISGYANIVGSSTGEIIGFTNVTTSTKMTIGTTEWNATDITNWNTAYSWGDHAQQNYATETYVDSGINAAVLGQGFADTAYVNLAINQLKNNAPVTLDTLGEIAAAINNDPGYYTTVNTALATKLNVADFNSTFDTRLATKTTNNIAEGTNLYYTDARVNTLLDTKTTNNIAEGTNLYYTDTRVNTLLDTKGYATETYVGEQVSALIDTAPETLDTLNELAAALGDDANFSTTITNSIATKLAIADFSTTFDTNLAAKTTTNLDEGTNLYYTDARVKAAISATGDISYNSETGVISFGNTSGFLTSVLFTDVETSAYLTSLNTWVVDADDKLVTAAAVQGRIQEETLDTITARGATTTNDITANDIIINGATLNSITSTNSYIDFNNKELRNVTFDFGSYGV